MNLQTIFDTVLFIFRILLIVSAVFCVDKILFIIAAFLPAKKFAPAKKNHKYALLIPARNESRVIESLLKSIQLQTYPRELMDIFVVVEDENDPTVEICTKYNAHVTVRKRLDLKGKGYALDELIQDMYDNGLKNKYDAYFIFDADNYLAPTYMEEMNKVFDAGYHISFGYRNSKNWNDGWVASCSALSFSMLNTFHNKFNSWLGRDMMLSGTGLFVDAKTIDALGGWKFHCLTEDVELAYFSALNGLKSVYCPAAEFFDEQPRKLRVSIKQRTRWLKGFFQATKKYRGKLISSAIREKGGRLRKLYYLTSLLPIVIPLIATAVYILFAFGIGLFAFFSGDPLYQGFLIDGAIGLGSLYLAVLFVNMLFLISELKTSDITVWNSIKTIIFGPVFLFFYLPIFVKTIFAKNITWEVIEHTVAFDLADRNELAIDNADVSENS